MIAAPAKIATSEIGEIGEASPPRWVLTLDDAEFARTKSTGRILFLPVAAPQPPGGYHSEEEATARCRNERPFGSCALTAWCARFRSMHGRGAAPSGRQLWLRVCPLDFRATSSSPHAAVAQLARATRNSRRGDDEPPHTELYPPRRLVVVKRRDRPTYAPPRWAAAGASSPPGGRPQLTFGKCRLRVAV
jgi:hypothetical protein